MFAGPALGLAIPGCNQILGIEDTSVAVDVLACADTSISSGLEPTPIDTEVSADDVTPSCGQASAKDQSFGFTAPVTDYYVFDTFASSFDTVLAVYEQCGGGELACNNNAAGKPQSELVYKLQEGQKALVVVDGYAGDSGTGILQVARVTCPDADLEGRAFPVDLSTVSFGDDFQGACGGRGQEDRAYHWVAPKDGLFAFRVDSPTFTPAISLLAGPRCSDTSLGCNAAASNVGHAEVVRRLRAGEAVTVQVDGATGAGAFSIDISERSARCPQESFPAGADGVVGGLLTQRALAPSCSPVEIINGIGQRTEMRDKSYSYTMPALAEGCASNCEFTLTAQQPMVLYVLERDDCSGPEFACKRALAAAGTSTYVSKISVPGAVGVPRPYTVVVADASSVDTTGRFDLNVSCSAVCLTGGGDRSVRSAR